LNGDFDEVSEADWNGERETPGNLRLRSLEEQPKVREVAPKRKKPAADSSLDDDGKKKSA
jgi:hypothetical protein